MSGNLAGGYTVSTLFPGMDPYLEDPLSWGPVHQRLIVYFADQLQEKLGTRYAVDAEERVYIEGADREVAPDVSLRQLRPLEAGPALALAEADAPEVVQVPALEVHEAYVAILDRRRANAVTTVLELLSPTNKYAGPGRDSYRAKQREVLASGTHLVEIDLLRAGPHVLAVPERVAARRGPYQYLVCVNRAQGRRDLFELYARTVRERLPRIRVPLSGDDPDVVLDIQAALASLYAAGKYRARLAYDAPCVPPLSADDQAWANQLIAAARQAEQAQGG